MENKLPLPLSKEKYICGTLKWLKSKDLLTVKEILKEEDNRTKKYLKKSKDNLNLSAKNDKYYKSICYSADGEYLIAGGNSKFVNLY